MFNKFNDYKSIEIAKLIQAIALERKIDVNKIFQITKFALLEVFSEIYGKTKIDIDINKNSSEISIVQCLKVVSDEDANIKKYIYAYEDEDSENNEEKEEEEDFTKSIVLKYKTNQEEGEDDNSEGFIEKQLKRIQNDRDMRYSTISLSDAKKYDQNAQIGQILRIRIENAWQNLENNNKLAKIFNKSFFKFLDCLVKEQEFLFFSKMKDKMINAFVKSSNKNGYVLSYLNYDLFLPAGDSEDLNKQKNFKDNDKKKQNKLRSEIIPGEYYGIGERIQVFVKVNKKEYYEAQNNNTTQQYQIVASRTHPGLLEELLKQNVPEIREGQVLVKDVQRIPGIRAKVVVFSTELGLDPVGACIGIRGVRIKSISKELRGEKIDIINYSDNLFELASNAMHPIKAIKVTEAESRNGGIKLIVTVDDKDLSSAIGKGGSNIKLLSRILKCHVEIIGSTVEEARRIKEYQEMLEAFKEKLDIEEIIAQILIINNFKTVEDIASAEISDLLKIEYFDEDLASELQNRALEYIYEEQQKKIQNIDEALKNVLVEFDNEDQDLLKLFAEKEIYSIQTLADFDIDELLEKLNDFCEEVSEELAEDLILSARKSIDFKIGED